MIQARVDYFEGQRVAIHRVAASDAVALYLVYQDRIERRWP
jgi:hypothetical protein